MDQQNPNEPTLTKDSPEPHDRASTPTEPTPKIITTSPSPPATPQVLSTSDTFLRFPRPQVNSDLADWISNSDPNIMRNGNPTEDSGLSDSTYELVHEDVDSESQDGYRTESMTGSMCSLDDLATADDVHSLAGTERTVDTESDTEGQGNSTLVAEGEQYSAQAQFDGSEDEDDDLDVITIHTPPPGRADDSDDDAASHESMEYTQQSLGTPTTQSIEQLKHTDHDDEYRNSYPVYEKSSPSSGFMNSSLFIFAKEAFYFTVLVLFLVYVPKPALFSSKPTSEGTPNLVTTSLTSTEAISTTASISSSLSTIIPTNGMALIPVEETPRVSFFGPKAPELVFTARKSGEILVSIPDEARNTWSSKNCLFVGASREDKKVEVQGSFSNEGAILHIPKKEAHGIVKLVIESKCGPKFSKVLDVYFSKGYIEEAYERTKHMVTDMRNVLPAAAQEAGRGFEFAKQFLGNTAQYLDWSDLRTKVDDTIRNITVATVPMVHQYQKAMAKSMAAMKLVLKDPKGSLKETFSVTKTTLKNTKSVVKHGISTARHSLADKISGLDMKTMSQVAHLSLVDAQISAKLWWLKHTGRMDEYSSYQAKAKAHLNQLRGKVPESVNKLSGILKMPSAEKIKQNICGGLKKRGVRFPQQCKHAA